MSKSQAKRIRVQKGWPMSEPTVEEVREALEAAPVFSKELWDTGRPNHSPAVAEVFDRFWAVARLWVDAAEPDIEAVFQAIKKHLAPLAPTVLDVAWHDAAVQLTNIALGIEEAPDGQ